MSHGPLRPAPPLSVSADGDLLPLVRAGDEQAFSALVARYHKRLVRLAQSFVRTAASAEEVA